MSEALNWTCAGCDKTITSHYSKVTVEIGPHDVVVCADGVSTDQIPRKSCAQKAFLKTLWGQCVICGKDTPGKGYRRSVPWAFCLECKKNLEALPHAEALRLEVQGLRLELAEIRAGQKLTYLEDRLLYSLVRRLEGLCFPEAESVLKQLALATTGRFVPETRGSRYPLVDERHKAATEALVKAWLSSLDKAEEAGRTRGRAFLLDLAAGTFEADTLSGVKKP